MAAPRESGRLEIHSLDIRTEFPFQGTVYSSPEQVMKLANIVSKAMQNMTFQDHVKESLSGGDGSSPKIPISLVNIFFLDCSHTLMHYHDSVCAQEFVNHIKEHPTPAFIKLKDHQGIECEGYPLSMKDSHPQRNSPFTMHELKATLPQLALFTSMAFAGKREKEPGKMPGKLPKPNEERLYPIHINAQPNVNYKNCKLLDFSGPDGTLQYLAKEKTEFSELNVQPPTAAFYVLKEKKALTTDEPTDETPDLLFSNCFDMPFSHSTGESCVDNGLEASFSINTKEDLWPLLQALTASSIENPELCQEFPTDPCSCMEMVFRIFQQVAAFENLASRKGWIELYTRLLAHHGCQAVVPDSVYKKLWGPESKEYIRAGTGEEFARIETTLERELANVAWIIPINDQELKFRTYLFFLATTKVREAIMDSLKRQCSTKYILFGFRPLTTEPCAYANIWKQHNKMLCITDEMNEEPNVPTKLSEILRVHAYFSSRVSCSENTEEQTTGEVGYLKAISKSLQQQNENCKETELVDVMRDVMNELEQKPFLYKYLAEKIPDEDPTDDAPNPVNHSLSHMIEKCIPIHQFYFQFKFLNLLLDHPSNITRRYRRDFHELLKDWMRREKPKKTLEVLDNTTGYGKPQTIEKLREKVEELLVHSRENNDDPDLCMVEKFDDENHLDLSYPRFFIRKEGKKGKKMELIPFHLFDDKEWNILLESTSVGLAILFEKNGKGESCFRRCLCPGSRFRSPPEKITVPLMTSVLVTYYVYDKQSFDTAKLFFDQNGQCNKSKMDTILPGATYPSKMLYWENHINRRKKPVRTMGTRYQHRYSQPDETVVGWFWLPLCSSLCFHPPDFIA